MKPMVGITVVILLAAVLAPACSGPDPGPDAAATSTVAGGPGPATGTTSSEQPSAVISQLETASPESVVSVLPSPTPATEPQQITATPTLDAASEDVSQESPTETPAAPPEPTPTSTRPPTPTPVPLQPLSPWYLDPELAVLQAVEDLGRPPNLQDSFVQLLLEDAWRFQRLYNIAHAQPGYFNTDTEDFLEWLKWFLSGGASDPALRTHVYAQIRIAIYNPQSDVGRRIRLIEAGEDPRFEGSGPSTFWEYLIGPVGYWEGRLGRQGLENDFARHATEYSRAIISNPTAYTDFGAYLVSVGYDMFGRLAVE